MFKYHKDRCETNQDLFFMDAFYKLHWNEFDICLVEDNYKLEVTNDCDQAGSGFILSHEKWISSDHDGLNFQFTTKSKTKVAKMVNYENGHLDFMDGSNSNYFVGFHNADENVYYCKFIFLIYFLRISCKIM
jgi:hypothetical protein